MGQSFDIGDIEIPEIEITEGWLVSELQTLEDCEDANAVLTAAAAGIEGWLETEALKPPTYQDGPRVGKAKAALRFKKAALNLVQQKRASLNEKRRAALEKEREDGLLAFIRSVVPPQQWLAWVTAHDAAPVIRKEAA